MAFDRYQIKLTLKRGMLGTVPVNPSFQNYIIGKANELISESSADMDKYNNRFASATPISQEKADTEIALAFRKIEENIGRVLTDDEKAKLLKGEDVDDIDPNKGVTGFFYNYEKNLPVISDHMIYGFLKSAAQAICRTRKEKKRGEMLQSETYSHSMINQYCRCEEQFITFSEDIVRNQDGSPAYYTRALRAMTAKGPRIALVRSEIIKKGASLNFVMGIWKDCPITEEHLDEMLDYGQLVGLGQFRSAGFGMFGYEMKKLKK